MILLYQFSILLTIALLYYNFALKYNILDLPNERSSHNETTVRGGGIIFPVAAILWIVFSGLHEHYYFIIGLLMISIVSLLDDFSGHQNEVKMLGKTWDDLRETQREITKV